MTADPFSLTRYRGVRALVLGPTGFIGRWVARALATAGARVDLAARHPDLVASVGREYGFAGPVTRVDLATPGAGGDLVETIGPDVVFNLAGYGVDRVERDEALAWRINRDLVAELGEALARIPGSAWDGQRLVHSGSAAEYGAIGGDLAETSVPQPITLYGHSKLAGTETLQVLGAQRGLQAVTARLFTVYGPGEHLGRLLPSLLGVARTGAPLPLTAGAQRRDFTYVEDVAEGLLRLGVAGCAAGDVVNVATGKLRSVREFALTAADVLGVPPERLRFGALPLSEEEMVHSHVTVARLERLVGWRPGTEVADGIRRTWESECRSRRERTTS